MAQLIQMRQRIKAIETIKKITHAMRLIAMSNHAQLKNKEEPIAQYTSTINDLFFTIKAQDPAWTHPVLYPINTSNTILVIVIGSQKGLCGSFNSAVNKLFDIHIPASNRTQYNYIAIGKKTVDFIRDAVPTANIVAVYNDFSSSNLTTLAIAISKILFEAPIAYSEVIIFSNKPKSFFVQKSHRTPLIPFMLPVRPDQPLINLEEYMWEQKPADILDFLAQQCIEANIQMMLFQSLLAEQSARFLSMDNSTRNAEGLLETTELQYNKLRQAKITKELTELTGSF